MIETSDVVGDADHAVFVRAFAPSPSTPPRTPLLFVHGGSHTGACYVETPDGRPGWAPYAAERGYPAYVVDWPGHGRSPARSDLATMSLQTAADGVSAVLEQLGRAVLVTHSMGGTIGWRVAEAAPERVAAIVAIAPGPPANLQSAYDAGEIAELQRDPLRYAAAGLPTITSEDAPTMTPRSIAEAMWANSDRFPKDAIDAYLRSIVPESARAANERNNVRGSGLRIAGPQALAGIPIVVITGDQDPRHPRVADARIAEYLGAEFVWLADRGLTGHGHMQMLEEGNLAIADLFLEWVDRHA